MVGNDYTVRWQRRRYQIPVREAKPRMKKVSVRIEQRLDGGLWLRWQTREIHLHECGDPEVATNSSTTDAVDKPARKAPTRKAPAKRRPKHKSRRMDGFSIGDPAPRRARATPVEPMAIRGTSYIAQSGELSTLR